MSLTRCRLCLPAPNVIFSTCFAISARTSRASPVHRDSKFRTCAATNRLVSRSRDLIARGSKLSSFSVNSWCSVSRSVSCTRREFESPMVAIASVQLRICRSTWSTRRGRAAVSLLCWFMDRASCSSKFANVYSMTSACRTFACKPVSSCSSRGNLLTSQLSAANAYRRLNSGKSTRRETKISS
jgi:hypothetical protein